jgi:ABC-type nitrate/sulfonate/bicarbonate transport system permease component
MLKYPKSLKAGFLVSITVVLFWIILTEIIFVGNKVFPSPSLVILSYLDLFSDYNFLINLVSSISAVYLSFFISIFILRIKFPLFNSKAAYFKYLIKIPNYFLFIPEMLIGVLLIYWFADNFIIKLVFGIFINAYLMYALILSFDNKVIQSQIDAAKSFGISDWLIRQKIVWKFIEPKLFAELISKQKFVWSSIIAFEFIQNYDGIGFVVRRALNFKDLSIIIAIIILLSVIILVFDKLLKSVQNKYFHWD